MANYPDNSRLYNSIQDLSNKSDSYNSVLKLIWNKVTAQSNLLLSHKGEIPSTDLNTIISDGIYNIKGERLKNGLDNASNNATYYGQLKVIHGDGQPWQFLYISLDDSTDSDGVIACRFKNQGWNAWRKLGTNAIQPLPSWVSDLSSVPDGRWYLPDSDIKDYDTIISQQTYNNGQSKVQNIIYHKDGNDLVRSFTNGKWNNWQVV